MTTDYAAIGIGAYIGICFLLLMTRMKSWNTDMVRWIVCGVPALIGIIILLVGKGDLSRDFNFMAWGLINPVFYNIADRLLKMLSEKLIDRDFILWIRGSSQLNRGWGADNSHVTFLDKVFSFLLLLVIIVLPFFHF